MRTIMTTDKHMPASMTESSIARRLANSAVQLFCFCAWRNRDRGIDKIDVEQKNKYSIQFLDIFIYFYFQFHVATSAYSSTRVPVGVQMKCVHLFQPNQFHPIGKVSANSNATSVSLTQTIGASFVPNDNTKKHSESCQEGEDAEHDGDRPKLNQDSKRTQERAA